jgi:hypothetical protein
MNIRSFFRKILIFLGILLAIPIIILHVLLFLESLGSQFVLAEDSKLPVWFTNKSNIPRENLEVQIAMAGLFPNRIKISIFSDGHVIEKATGTWRWHPKSLKNNPLALPEWIIININGTEEIYEHREEDDVQRIVSEDEVMSTTPK